MLQIVMITLGIIVTLFLIAILMLNPSINIEIFKLNSFKFRVKKKRLDNYYYLQMRVCGIWYFIDRYRDDFILDVNSGPKSIHYPSHYLTEFKNKKIYDDRWEVLKYFSDTGNPDDTQNI